MSEDPPASTESGDERTGEDPDGETTAEEDGENRSAGDSEVFPSGDGRERAADHPGPDESQGDRDSVTDASDTATTDSEEPLEAGTPDANGGALDRGAGSTPRARPEVDDGTTPSGTASLDRTQSGMTGGETDGSETDPDDDRLEPDDEPDPPVPDRVASDDSTDDGDAIKATPPGLERSDGTPDDVPEDVRRYARFSKMDGATYERVNGFLRDRTYITAREWAIARLCADFRTETGVEMTKIGENLPTLVPFMTDTYTPQAVNQARHSFEKKVTKSGSTFLYGAMCDFFTAEELDDLMYEVTEVAKFLLEVEGVDLTVDEELDAEERISSVMREVRRASDELRHGDVECPHCGKAFSADGAHDE